MKFLKLCGASWEKIQGGTRPKTGEPNESPDGVLRSLRTRENCVKIIIIIVM